MADVSADLGLNTGPAMADVVRLEQRLSAMSRVDLDFDGLDPAVRDARRLERETEKVGRNVDRAARSSRTMRQQWQRIRNLVIATGAARGLVKMVEAASDLEEAVNAAQVVFGDAFDQIERGATDSTAAIVLARDEYLDAAAGLGALATNAGLTDAAAADLSTTMIDLAADLSSIRNLEVAEALEKIRSGLVGETEPLRQYAGNISAAAVETKALELNLVAAGEELTEQAALQARAALIAERLAFAEGDLVRTQESYANSTRALRKDARELAQEVGAVLMPVFVDLVALARDEAIPAFRELGPALGELLGASIRAGLPLLQALLDILVELTPVVQLLADVVGALPDGMVAVAGATLILSRAMRTLRVASGAAAGTTALAGVARVLLGPAGLIALMTAAAVVTDDLDERLQALATTGVADAIADGAASAARAAREVAALNEVLAQAGEGHPLADRLTRQVDALDAALARLATTNGPAAREFFADMVRETIELGGSVDDLIARFPQFGDQARRVVTDMLGLSRAQDDAAAAAAELAAQIEKVGEEAEDAGTELERYLDSIDRAIGGQVAADRAAIGFRKSLFDLQLTLAEGATTLDVSSQRGREVAGAFADVASSILRVTEATAEQTGSARTANQVQAALVAELVATAQAAGLTNDQIDGLIERFGLMPRRLTLGVDLAAGDAGGLAAANLIGGLIGGIDAQQADIAAALEDTLTAAADQAVTATVSELVGDLIGGIDAAIAAEQARRGIGRAEDTRRDAQARLADLAREAEDLPFAVRRAQFEVDQATTPQARAAAFRQLQELQARQRDIGADQAAARRDIADAEERIVEASLQVVQAELALADAGRQVQAAGDEIVAAFRAVAGEAGLSVQVVERLLARLDDATAKSGQLAFLGDEVTVPGAAAGMIVDPVPGGRLIRVAEDGQREVVIPASRPVRAAELLAQAGLGDLLGAGQHVDRSVRFDVSNTFVGQPRPEVTARQAVMELEDRVFLGMGGLPR